MLLLIAGIVLFFGVHSVSIFAEPFRDRQVALSEYRWKSIYSLLSLAGIVLIVIGYGDARLSPSVLYVPPAWLRHVSLLLLLPVFVLFVAPYLPGRISKATVHPQLVAVKLWAFSHLLVNGTLADVVLFGSFLAWAVADRISMKRRTPRALPGPPPAARNDLIAIVLGLALYAVAVIWLHDWLFGIRLIA